MKLRSFNLIVLACILLTAASANFAQAPFAGFDEYVNSTMKDWEVPGMSIAVVKDDKVVYAKGYGVRELGKTDAVDEHTIFAIGSSSKAFTATAIGMLVDEKKLKWDDKVSEYLPRFQLFDPWVTREMTVRDLLTHRIGLERGDQLWYATAYSRDEVLRRIRYLEPSSSMRSKFGYQNIMYLAAGQIIPVVEKDSWDDFVAKRIFTPLGMKESSTTIRDLSKTNDVAAPHVKIDGKVTPVAWRLIDNIGPAGSINSNAVDMAQWVRLQLGNGKFDGKQIVSPAVINETHTPQTIIRREGMYTFIYPDAHFFSYGMGWFLSDFGGKALVEHGGAIDGMRGTVAMIPEKNVGVVILTNMNGSILPQFLAYRILDEYLDREPRDWPAEGLKKFKPLEAQAEAAQAKAAGERVMNTKPSLGLADYAGKYTSEMYGDVDIEMVNGKLIAKFGPYYTGDLEHWNYDTFQVAWRDQVIGKGLMTFTLNAKGKVDSLGFGGMGKFKKASATVK